MIKILLYFTILLFIVPISVFSFSSNEKGFSCSVKDIQKGIELANCFNYKEEFNLRTFQVSSRLSVVNQRYKSNITKLVNECVASDEVDRIYRQGIDLDLDETREEKSNAKYGFYFEQSIKCFNSLSVAEKYLACARVSECTSNEQMFSGQVVRADSRERIGACVLNNTNRSTLPSSGSEKFNQCKSLIAKLQSEGEGGNVTAANVENNSYAMDPSRTRMFDKTNPKSESRPSKASGIDH